MKHLFIIILSIGHFYGASQSAEDSDKVFQDANLAYSKGDYTKALSSYEGLINQKLQSSELYYNLGNTYFKSNKIGHAILYYEKAKLLAPNNKAINKNLNIAREQVESDILEIPDFLPVRLWRGLSNTLGPLMWIIIQMLMGILLLWGISTFFKDNKRGKRLKSGAIIATAIVMLIISYAAGKTSHNMSLLHDQGIILTSSMMKSAPDNRSDNIELLSEGVKIQLLDEIDNWYKVRLMNKNIGWVPNESFDRI